MLRIGLRWVLCGVLLAQAFVVAAVELIVTPDCPAPDQSILIKAYQSGGVPALERTPLEVTVSAGTIRMVSGGSDIDFGPNAPTSSNATVGPLSVGTYHIDFFVRIRSSAGLSPEMLEATRDFTVSVNPPPCTPAKLKVAAGMAQVALLNQPFPSSIHIVALDDKDRPVPNVRIQLSRLISPADLPQSALNPAATLSMASGVTDQLGMFSVSAVANGVPGTAQYYALTARGDVQYRAFFVLSNSTAYSASPVAAVAEFYNRALFHFFLTADLAEAELLDNGTIKNWERTGAGFLAFISSAAGVPTETSAVCRFYGRPEAGLDSHLFTASSTECVAVQQQFGANWVLESADVFRVWLPDVTSGACPSGAPPVYRVYNNKPDANHRYTTSRSLREQMLALGWIAEGYGSDAVAMCIPL